MKNNFYIYVVTILFLLTLVPLSIQAEEQNSNKGMDSAETNTISIKQNTIIYGEDISELPEEELKYIPKSWREGNFESEHSENTHSNNIRKRTAYPNVNDYVENIKATQIEYEQKDFFAKFPYRYGYGEVEGVVAHETANDGSSITGEISFMSKNHENAFVHAFVDHERIIQIHPLDYGAWGAGRHANKRFVHVELVRVNNFDQFAKSINNYADYISRILYNYKLGVDSAEYDGSGTLWSHKAVSVHLGATTHVDPHGYFSRYGYNWNNFTELVNKKYNNIINNREPNTSKLGHLKSTNVKIYSSPLNLENYTTAGTKYTNEVYYIKAETRLNGEDYFLLSREPSSKRGTIGWVRKVDVSSHTHKTIEASKESFVIKGKGSAFNKAWGGSKNLVFKLSSFEGEKFVVNLTETVGNNIWYRGTLDGKTVWLHSNYVTNIIEENTSKLGHIRSEGVPIYKEIHNLSDYRVSGKEYTHKVYYIKKKAKIGRDLFYLISNKPSRHSGVIGWVRATDMRVHSHVGIDKNDKTFTLTGEGSAYSKAWGGAKDRVYKLSSFGGQIFKVNLTEKVGNNVWYRGIISGKEVWLHSSYLIDKQKTSKLGHLRNAKVNIYSGLDNKQTSKVAGSKFTNAVYYIKQQASIKNKRYYLISTEPSSKYGVVGWVEASDISIHEHKGVDNKSKTYYLKGTGSAYSKAWGGVKDVIHRDLSRFKHREFKVNLTEKVGNNTWYRGEFNDQEIWLHSSYVVSKEFQSTSKLGHFKYKESKIYPILGSKQFLNAGETYTNRVYYIKKQATMGKDTYFLISTEPSSKDGVVGWVDKSALSTHPHAGVSRDKKTLKIKGSGVAYNTAWGGYKNKVFDLNNFKGKSFNVHLTEKVGNNIWYRGILNGNKIWIHNSYLE
ncbi:GW dipeptide domain-containing protein [Virgibacillus halodenitrificans]|uniref:peptidoglycan recognition protein family protein n=1 Tax=Virgibacillus halodenitrificans TaxID=1482 RepID=UPI001FB3E33F|nr:GW dipeptide domain-containing protein [Virgibacillus halodenitrificans]MCJ0929619.1 GW dipeptide domain-containing protein [Virgibacillus halodenitrificans]WHX26074.1 GW dipeptide domain-containing protein [Virgibacillus halodenitrificans]